MAYATIDLPDDYFNTVLYTGNDSVSGISITGVGFQPDLLWIKNRSSTPAHVVYDNVRTSPAKYLLQTNTTVAERTAALGSFDSDGFTVTDNDSFYNSAANFVAWNWKGSNIAGGSSNTDGSITSSVSANTTSGFSIVSYTGTGANATVGHGLGVAPKMIILKSRTDSGADWRVYHASVGNTGYLELNTTGATTTSSTTWQNTTPTSTVFSIGTSGTVNLNTGNFIAYCFAEKKGFSKFGSYTGNGSADGTFVYTGFKPAFVMFKITNTTGNWYLNDTTRRSINVNSYTLFPNLSNAETTTGAYIDMLSNGFKLRDTGAAINGSGNTFIYMAFAEKPFVGSNFVPTTAR